MGKQTGIPWTRSTRNFWSGCTKIGDGCLGCYAEASSRRMHGTYIPVTPLPFHGADKSAKNWGPGVERIPHLAGADRDIRKWNNGCVHERTMLHQKRELTTDWPHPGFWPVFINSYSDTFDNEVPQGWRRILFTTIEDCEALTFQLVTKRISNVLPMLEGRWDEKTPGNVWLIVTVVTQAELDRDGPKLLRIARHNLGLSVIGLSVEPQIEEIDARPFLEEAHQDEQVVWGICGGESNQAGHPARPFDLTWGMKLASDFAAFEQPFFFKQTGSNVTDHGEPYTIGGKGDTMEQWPAELRVREFPKVAHVR